VVSDKTYTPPKLANPGNIVQQFYTSQEMAALLSAYETSDLVDTVVGGGRMADDAEESKLASRNEAPFPRRLADFMVQSFCPPDGIVCDCFLGSATTLASALAYGRRAIGCDVRAEMIELAKQRIVRVPETSPGQGGES
jgi:DNA modification methylase